MVVSDQPAILSSELLVSVSDKSDGPMLDRSLERHAPSVKRNRTKWLGSLGLDYDDVAYQIITYADNRTYDDIVATDSADPRGIEADVLFTKSRNVVLFLPVADCIGTVIYDPTRHYLALAHLGRHASIAKTISKTLDYFAEKGSNMADVRIYMTPSVATSDYVMQYFDHLDDPDWRNFSGVDPDGIHLDLRGFNANLALLHGIDQRNIEISTINTARDEHYYSHFAGDKYRRFAVLAVMR